MTSKRVVTSKEFVETWMEAWKSGEDVRWVANKLGIAEKSVIQRAYNYRRRGVKLPKYKDSAGTNVDKLNAMIEDAMGSQEVQEKPEPMFVVAKYGRHKLTLIDGEDIYDRIDSTMEQEAQMYNVTLPNRGQVGLVLSAIRMQDIMLHAGGYDRSESGQPNKVAEHAPIETSMGRYFRDAGTELLINWREEENDRGEEEIERRHK